jgi:hypothetical protein
VIERCGFPAGVGVLCSSDKLTYMNRYRDASTHDQRALCIIPDKELPNIILLSDFNDIL